MSDNKFGLQIELTKQNIDGVKKQFDDLVAYMEEHKIKLNVEMPEIKDILSKIELVRKESEKMAKETGKAVEQSTKMSLGQVNKLVDSAGEMAKSVKYLNSNGNEQWTFKNAQSTLVVYKEWNKELKKHEYQAKRITDYEQIKGEKQKDYLDKARLITKEINNLNRALSKDNLNEDTRKQLNLLLKDYKKEFNDLINGKFKVNKVEYNRVDDNDRLKLVKQIELTERGIAIQKENSENKTIANEKKRLQLQEQKRVDKLGVKTDLTGSGLDFKFTDDNEYIMKLSKSLYGLNSQLKSVDTSKKDLTKGVIKFTTEVKNADGTTRKMDTVLDKHTQSLYQTQKGYRETSNVISQFGSRFKAMLSSLVVYDLGREGIEQIKKSITFMNELDKSQTNIAMVTGESKQSVKELTHEYSLLADQLNDTTSSVMKGAEEFLRAGNDQAETMKLLEASTVGSKLSGQTQDEMAQQMIAIKEGFTGFKDGTKDMMDAIDAISLMDNQSATSFAEISSALRYTTKSAEMAGVSFEELVAYITQVSGTTRLASETIGQAFKTLFARFSDIKVGKEVDEYGEDISNVEASLRKVGVQLRSSETEFRNFSDVMAELSTKWSTFNDIEKNDLAKSLAGTRQREVFYTLMQGYEEITNNVKDMDEAHGNAKKRFDEMYGSSTEAKINNLKNSIEKLYMTMMNSDTINTVVVGMTKFTDTLRFIMANSDGARDKIILLTSAMAGLIGVMKLMSFTGYGFIDSLKYIGLMIAEFISGITLSTGLVGGLIIALGFLAVNVYKTSKAKAELKQKTDELATSYKNLNSEIANNKSVLNSENYNQVKSVQDEINDRLAKQIELREKLNNTQSKVIHKGKDGIAIETDKERLSVEKEISENNRAIEQQIKMLQNAGIQFKKTGDEVNGYKIEIIDLIKAESESINNELINSVEEKASKLWNNRDAVRDLINEYQTLDSSENTSYDTMQRMTTITNELQRYLVGLKTKTDEYGHTVIENTSLLSDNISMLNTEGLTYGNVTDALYNHAKNSVTIQNGLTQVTYEQAKRRIEVLKEEMSALGKIMGASSYALSQDEGMMNKATLNAYKIKMQEYNNLLTQINDIDSAISKPKTSYLPTDKDGYIPVNDSDSKSGGKNSDITSKIDRYYKLNEALKKVTNSLDLIKEKEDRDSVDVLEKEVGLLKQKQIIENDIYSERIKEQKELAGKLSSNGFKFNGDSITNYNERIQALTNSANKMTGDSKDKAKDHVEELVKMFERYSDLTNSEIPEMNKQWYETGNAIKEVKKEIFKLTVDGIEKTFNKSITQIEEKLADLDLADAIADDDVSSKLSNAERRFELVKQQISETLAEMDKLTKVQANNSDEVDELNEKYRDAQNKLRDYQKELESTKQSVKELGIEQIGSVLEKSIYGTSKADYERQSQGKINGYQDEIDKLQEKWDLEDKQREKEEKQNEINLIKNKILKLQNNTLSQLTEQQAKELDLESERDKVLEHQAEMQELQLKLSKLKEQQTNKELVRNEDGSLSYEWAVDQKKVEEIQDEIKEKQDEFDKWRTDTLDDLQDSLKDKEKDFERWKEENSRNQQIKDLQKLIEHEQNQLKVKQEFLDETKRLLELNYDPENPESLNSIIGTGLSNIEELYGNSFDGIYSTIRQCVSDSATELAKLQTILQQVLSAKNSIIGASSTTTTPTSTGKYNASELGKLLNGNLEHDSAVIREYERTHPKYASGTTSALGGVSVVGEGGRELRVLNKGDGIIPNDLTERLMMLGKNAFRIMDLINLPNLKSPKLIGGLNGGNTIINVSSLELPNITDSVGVNNLMNAFKQLPTLAKQK